MTVSRNSYWEWKNWVGSQYQEDTPVLDDEDTRESELREHWVRRAICELVGNGSANDGFKLSGSVGDPNIAAGDIFVCGMKIEIPTALTESTQPHGTQTPPSGNGVWYLVVKRILQGQAEDPDLIHPDFPGVESVKMWKADWTLKKALGAMPAPAADEINIAIATEAGSAITEDLRNTGEIEAGSSTEFQGREGKGLADASGLDHNTLGNLQGGDATNRWHFPKDEYDAGVNANSPTAANPFATMGDISGTTGRMHDAVQSAGDLPVPPDVQDKDLCFVEDDSALYWWNDEAADQGAPYHKWYILMNVTAQWHNSQHTAGYNDALAITPDVGSNTTIGDHMDDSSIHATGPTTDKLVGVTAADTTPSYLDSKLTVTEGVSKTVTTPAGNEGLQLKLANSGHNNAKHSETYLTGATHDARDHSAAAASIALGDLGSRPHSSLQSVLGSGEHHLSGPEHTDLTDSGETTLHTHDHTNLANVLGSGEHHFSSAQHAALQGGPAVSADLWHTHPALGSIQKVFLTNQHGQYGPIVGAGPTELINNIDKGIVARGYDSVLVAQTNRFVDAYTGWAHTPAPTLAEVDYFDRVVMRSDAAVAAPFAGHIFQNKNSLLASPIVTKRSPFTRLVQLAAGPNNQTIQFAHGLGTVGNYNIFTAFVTSLFKRNTSGGLSDITMGIPVVDATNVTVTITFNAGVPFHGVGHPDNQAIAGHLVMVAIPTSLGCTVYSVDGTLTVGTTTTLNITQGGVSTATHDMFWLATTRRVKNPGGLYFRDDGLNPAGTTVTYTIVSTVGSIQIRGHLIAIPKTL